MQRRNLFAMQEKLGQPSCFFTPSAADLHWPELFDLAQHYNKDSTSEELYRSYRKRNETFNANPMLADWFFTRRAFEFLKTFLVPVLGFEDYWPLSINTEEALICTVLVGYEMLPTSKR